MVALGTAVLALIAGNAPSHVRVAAKAIKIGVLTDCSGFWSFERDNTLAGADLALIQDGATAAGTAPGDGVVGATIRRRPIELSFGCSDGSPASALEEARRLVERVGVSVLIGPLNGDEELALQAYARLRPAIAFVNGSASVRLQHPAPNFFSFHADGAQWSAGTGSYAFHELGWRRAVTITDEHDMFNWSQTAGFVAEFCSLGGTIVKRLGVPSGTTDFSSVLAQLPRVGVDGVYVATDEAVPVALLNAYPLLGRHAAQNLMIGATNVGNLFAVPSDRLTGLVYSDRDGPAGEPGSRFARNLRMSYPQIDPDYEGVFDQDYYVAMRATLQALTSSGGGLAHGERRFLAALARVRLMTPEGPIRLDANHQAITSSFLWQVKGRRMVDVRLLRTIPNIERTFGGYLTAHDPPAIASTPACKRGHVASWAR